MSPQVNLNVKMEGIYRCRTYMEDGTLTQDTGEFHNLITNGGMDYFGGNTTGTTPYTFVAVGSGNTTPAFTDSSLVSLVASVNPSANPTYLYVPAAGTQPPYGTGTTTYTFGVGAAAGNLAEIGVGPTTTNLFSRALIVDNTGAPTTITVLPTEILIVTYEFRVYYNVPDVSDSYAISAVSYATTSRPYRLNTVVNQVNGLTYNSVFPTLEAVESATLGPITGSVTASSLGAPTPSTYTNGTFFRDFTSSSGISLGNFATGIGMLHILSCLGGWQISHSPKIPKDNTKSMTLVFRISWARFTPPP